MMIWFFKLLDAAFIGLHTIKKLCDGLGISVRDFFDSELFSNSRAGNQVGYMKSKIS